MDPRAKRGIAAFPRRVGDVRHSRDCNYPSRWIQSKFPCTCWRGTWLPPWTQPATGTTVKKAAFQLVRHNERNETVLCMLRNEDEVFKQVSSGTTQLGTRLTPQGDQVAIELGA